MNNMTIDSEEDLEVVQLISRIESPGFMPVKTMCDLYQIQYNGKEALVEGLLYPGIYILAGSPKLGKSLLLLQLSFNISTGKPIH